MRLIRQVVQRLALMDVQVDVSIIRRELLPRVEFQLSIDSPAIIGQIAWVQSMPVLLEQE
jgi:hypothetical protein